MDIIKEIEKLYEVVTIGYLIENKEQIKKIADECKQREIFINAIDRYEEVKKELLKVVGYEKRIIAAWNNLDEKLNNAPTQLHFLGSAILTFPLVSDMLFS